MEAWLAQRPGWPRAAESPALIVGNRGDPLTAQAARQCIEAIGNQAGIEAVSPGGFAPEVLRATFISQLVREGVGGAAVAELTGQTAAMASWLLDRPVRLDPYVLDCLDALGMNEPIADHQAGPPARRPDGSWSNGGAAEQPRRRVGPMNENSAR
ncbi:MAG: tyrosine-type recombinase/integrase [Actinomycetota bacterium]